LAEYRMMYQNNSVSMRHRIEDAEQTNMSIQIKNGFGPRMIAGMGLIVTGGLLLVQQAGYLQAIDLARSWPLILIAFAIMQLGTTLKDSRQRGWGLLALGDWLFANTMTDWEYAQLSMPILLTGIGAAMVVRSLRQRRKTGHLNRYAT
jgi:hypothetical protein